MIYVQELELFEKIFKKSELISVFFKGYRLQILLDPLLNTKSHIIYIKFV